MDYLILILSVTAIVTVIIFYLIDKYLRAEDVVAVLNSNLPEVYYNIYTVEVDGKAVWWIMRSHLGSMAYYPIPDGLVVDGINATQLGEEVEVMVDRHGLDNDLSFAGHVIDRVVFRWYRNPAVFYEALGVDKKELGCDKRTIGS